MINKKIVFAILALLLITLFTLSAYADYPQEGNANSDYTGDSGMFNQQITTNWGQETAVITKGQRLPLTVDLDDNGTQEVILLDDTTLKIYDPRTLFIRTSLSTGKASGTRFSNIVTQDIDSDGYKEIILASETDTPQILIYHYNGTVISLQTTLNFNSSHTIDGEILIGCETDQCIAVTTRSNTKTGNADVDLSAYGFDATGITQAPLLLDSNSYGAWCFPQARSMTVDDYDMDGTKEYIFSIGHAGGGISDAAKMSLNVFILTANQTDPTSKPFEESTIVETDLIDWGNQLQSCDEKLASPGMMFSNIITNALVMNADTNGVSSKEIIIGYIYDGLLGNHARISFYDTTGTRITRKPDAVQETIYPGYNFADYISNLAKTNAFSDVTSCGDGTNKCGVCMMIHEVDETQVRVLCASLLSTQLDAPVYESSTSSTINPLPYAEYDSMVSVIHATDQSITNNPGADGNLDEILSNYGVLSFDKSDYSLDLIFGNWGQDNATIIVSDAEGSGYGDLISYVDNNFYYVDDGFINTGGEVLEVCTNPCTNGVWKINTSVSVTATITDINGDLVSSKAELYSGSLYEQGGVWSNYSDSDTVFPFWFVANHTGSWNLIVYGRDSENPDEVDVEVIPFSVGNSGLEYGDCDSCIYYEVEDMVGGGDSGVNETLAELDEIDPDDNAVKSVFYRFFGTTGLSYTFIWLLIMAMVGWSFFNYVGSHDTMGSSMSFRFAGLLIIEGMLTFLGAVLGFFSVFVIVFIVLLCAAVVVVFAWSSFTGMGRGG